MNFQILYEDENLLAINKPPFLSVFKENQNQEKTLIEYLIEQKPELKKVQGPPRWGLLHRLDKNTSGVLLIAKNERALTFFQDQFKKRQVKKNYLALVVGNVQEEGTIETLIGRDKKNPKKQRVFSLIDPEAIRKGLRFAKTSYKVIERFGSFTLLKVIPETGRKHQIRAHLAYLHHPIAGDEIYGFKNQPRPQGLKRQFLHAQSLELKNLKGGKIKIKAPLPNDLKIVLKNLKK
jgi:23S rRNA pseudouridine1911/1915/1917 synthase